MPSDKGYLDLVLENIPQGEDVSYRAMMGEYVIYYRGKVVGGVYDDRFLIKDTPSAKALLPNAEYALPYVGGKPMLQVEDVENGERTAELLNAVYGDLITVKPKKKK